VGMRESGGSVRVRYRGLGGNSRETEVDDLHLGHLGCAEWLAWGDPLTAPSLSVACPSAAGQKRSKTVRNDSRTAALHHVSCSSCTSNSNFGDVSIPMKPAPHAKHGGTHYLTHAARRSVRVSPNSSPRKSRAREPAPMPSVLSARGVFLRALHGAQRRCGTATVCCSLTTATP
jgi:hypothetical protein